MSVNKKVKKYFGTNEGEGDPARLGKVAKRSSECHQHSENAKKGHFNQILREIPRGQNFFPSGQAQFWQER